MNFDPAERVHLEDMRCLAKDEDGVEVYIGLTSAESNEYFALTRPYGAVRQLDEAMRDHNVRLARFLALHHLMRSAQSQGVKAERLSSV